MFWQCVLTICFGNALLQAPAESRGTISIDIISPSPLLVEADGNCTFTYHAILKEPLMFDVIAHKPAEDSISLIVTEKNALVSGCPFASVCYSDMKCSYICNASSAISTTPIQERRYGVTAAPYVNRISKVEQSVCVQVKDRRDLLFTRVPGDALTVYNKGITLVYEVDGYPLPALIALVCDDDRYTTNNTQGVFQLLELPEGLMNCSATASNRVSQAYSSPTLIRVVRTTNGPTSSTGIASAFTSPAIPAITTTAAADPATRITAASSQLTDTSGGGDIATGAVIGCIVGTVAVTLAAIGVSRRLHARRVSSVVVNNDQRVLTCIHNDTRVINVSGGTWNPNFLTDEDYNAAAAAAAAAATASQSSEEASSGNAMSCYMHSLA